MIDSGCSSLVVALLSMVPSPLSNSPSEEMHLCILIAGLNGGLLILTDDPNVGVTDGRSVYVLGIAAFDRADRFGMDKNLPILFTRVVSFKDWIVGVIKNATMVTGAVPGQADVPPDDCSALGTTVSAPLCASD